MLRARDALVRCRTALINHVRGVLKSLGCRARTCSARAFDQQAREAVPAEVRVALEPVLDQVGTLTAQIRLLDRRVEEMAEKEHPEAQPLMKVNGVGALTALAPQSRPGASKPSGLMMTRSHGSRSSTRSAVLPMNSRLKPRRATAPMTTKSAACSLAAFCKLSCARPS